MIDFVKEHYSQENKYEGLERYKEIAKMIGHMKLKGKMLDVGCREGILTGMIMESTGMIDVHGVDIADEALKNASGLGIMTHKVNLEEDKLPFKDDFFDVVLCLDVIEHIIDTDFLIEEIRRVLKSNGTLILMTFNLAFWFNRILLLFGYQPSGTEVSLRRHFGTFRKGKDVDTPGGHVHVFTYKALIEFVKFHKFKARAYPIMMRGKEDRIFKVINNLISKKTSLSPLIILKCVKWM